MSLLLFDGETPVGQVDFCDVDPFGDGPAPERTLYIWRIVIDDTRRGEGLTRVLLDELRARYPCAQYLKLDVGTAPAHAVIQSWLGQRGEQRAIYALPAA